MVKSLMYGPFLYHAVVVRHVVVSTFENGRLFLLLLSSLSLVLFYYIEEVVVTSLLSRISFQQRRCNAQGSCSKGVMGTIAPINVEKIFQCSCKLFHRHTSQKRLYMVTKTCGHGRGVGGTGLMWVNHCSFIFEFERGNFELSNF